MKGLFTANGKDEAFAGLMSMILNQVLTVQASEQISVQPYERSDERRNYRNGYRKRELYTRVGKLQLMVPRLRNGDFSTELFQRYQRSEQALVLAMMEMVVQGVVDQESGGHHGGVVGRPFFEIDNFRAVRDAGFCGGSFPQHAPEETVSLCDGGRNLYKGEGRRAGKVQRADDGAGSE